MARVKICGITCKKAIHLCASCGADALGFVVEYPIEVPWNLSRAFVESVRLAFFDPAG